MNYSRNVKSLFLAFHDSNLASSSVVLLIFKHELTGMDMVKILIWV